jgi:hypothetical protein
MIHSEKTMVGKPKRKRTLGRRRRRRTDKIKIDLKIMEHEGWTEFVWLRLKRNNGIFWTRR